MLRSLLQPQDYACLVAIAHRAVSFPNPLGILSKVFARNVSISGLSSDSSDQRPVHAGRVLDLQAEAGDLDGRPCLELLGALLSGPGVAGLRALALGRCLSAALSLQPIASDLFMRATSDAGACPTFHPFGCANLLDMRAAFPRCFAATLHA